MKRKLMRFNKSIYSTHMLVISIAFFAFVLSSLFIWTQDDYWTVGIYNFDRAWAYSVSYGNGRYLGNFFVNLIMCRGLLDDVVRVVLIVTSIVSVAVLVGSYKKRALILSSLLHMGVSIGMFSNTYSWGHGFYNYVPPVVLMLVSLCLLKKYYQNKAYSCTLKIICCVLLFVFGISQQLFSENSTTIILLVSFAVLIYVKIKKSNIIPVLIYFISSLIGTGIMFIIPTLCGVSHKMDFYREINGFSERIAQLIENTQISFNSISCMYMLNIVLSLSLIILMKEKCTIKGKYKFICFIILIVQPIVSLMRLMGDYNIFSIIGAISTVAYLPTVVYLLIKLTDNDRKYFRVGILILSLLSVLQLLVVKPIGPRCFYITYILLSLVVISVFFEAVGYVKIRGKQIIATIFGVLGIAVYVILFVVHFESYKINNLRFEYADEQFAQGKTVIEIIRVPHERWLHYPNVHFGFADRYEYDDGCEVSFVYLDYEDYVENMKRLN